MRLYVVEFENILLSRIVFLNIDTQNTNTLEQVRGDLALRAQVEEVVNKLKHALETLNPEELSLSNDQAQELDLENHSKFGDIAKRARKKQKIHFISELIYRRGS